MFLAAVAILNEIESHRNLALILGKLKQDYEIKESGDLCQVCIPNDEFFLSAVFKDNTHALVFASAA